MRSRRYGDRKQLLSLTLIVCILLSLAACTKPAPQDPTTPTTTPTTPPVPTSFNFENRLEYGTKEGGPGFFKLLSEQMPDDVGGLNSTAEEDCCNITPPGADANTDLQVFMSRKTGQCYIVQDGKITSTIMGPLNQVLCDLDKDGKNDYMYALSLNDTVDWFLEKYGLIAADIRSERLDDTNPGDGCTIDRYEYVDQNGNVPVVTYIVNNGGHTWPGGSQYSPSYYIGALCKDAQASELIWNELKDVSK